MDKRILLAVALSIAVFIGWDFFFASQKQPPVTPAPPAATQSAPVKKAVEPAKPAAVSEISVPKSNAKEEQAAVSTGVYDIVMSNKGGRIDSLKYGSRKVELVDSPSKSGFDFPVAFSEREFLAGSPMQNAVWTMTKKSEKDIVFSIAASVNGTPVVLEKEFLFNDKEHYFDLVFRIKNTGKAALKPENGSLYISPTDGLGPVMADPTLVFNMLSAVYNIDGSFEKGSKGGGMFSDATDTKSHKGKTNWYGIISRYFTILMIPQDSDKAAGVI